MEIFKVNETIVDGTGSIGGISELVARNEIHLTSGFHALKGSDTHIYLAETFTECENYSGFIMRQSSLPQITSLENENPNNNSTKIELKFQLSNEDFTITPNPAKDFFKIDIYNIQQTEPSLISIYNSLGENIANYGLTNSSITINSQSLLPGSYIIQLKYDNKSLNKKLIIY